MRRPCSCWLVFLAFATLATGCHYVHFGRPERFRTDAKLAAENADLRVEKKLLQQELAIARKEGEALRAAVERPREGAQDLVAQLNETTRELAALRASYARLKAERERVQSAPAAAGADEARLAELQTQLGETENKLAETLRTFTSLQEENTRLRSSIDTVRVENAQLTTRLEHVTAANTEARSALAELNTELLAQKTARAEAEQQTEALRAQLVAMANAGAASEPPSLAAARESSATGAREMEATLRSPLFGTDSSAGAVLSIDSTRLRAATGAPLPTAPVEPAASAAPTPAPEPAASTPPAPAAKPARTYVVQAGDTLEKISRKFYGRPDRWNLLYTANTALLSERPLAPGMELTIPAE